MSVNERFKDYNKPHCWQYEIKLQNLQEDLNQLTFNPKDVQLSSLVFSHVPKDDNIGCLKVKAFIEKNEWLGKMPARPTHRFTSTYKGITVSVVVMATPNAFSTILGRGNEGLEKLIARGASASWAPRNIGSWSIMKAINWMVGNTEFRVFTGYADTEAKELGTIYQACNFYYLGKSSGTQKLYFDPERPHLGWFNDRNFRHRSNYNRYGREIGYRIPFKKYAPDWDVIPEEIIKQIKEGEKRYRERCIERIAPSKHKYAYIKGMNKGETRRLLKTFHEYNKVYPYPTQR
jgi:hypothetical protein